MSERGSSESCRSRLSTSNSKFRSRDLWRRSANLSEQLSQETLKKLFSSDQSQKDKPCNFCERMIKDGGMEVPGAESQCSWLFHDDAPEGPNRRSDPDFSEWNQTTRNRHLCDFCSHLRLMRLRRLTRTKGPTFWIYLDDLDALRSRPDCVFCRLLVKIITRYSASLPDFRPVSRVKLCVDEFPEYKDGFLQIVDENEELITTLECQLDTEEVFPDKMYLERPTLRTRTIDWDKANLWLKRRNPPAVPGDRPVDFRVIDVVDECVVAAPPECEYVTLSYVWGPWQPAKRTLKATKANIEEFASPGFLKGKKIPATIADAMAVCSLIGKRYLWVDRFCIIQDDADSWRAQTDAMDKIYSNSYVTLVAMEGNDAHAGLRGVSGVRSYEVLFQGMKIWENCPSPPGGMSESTWSTRGWTLQEALLSQNLLIFTEKRVFFESLENLGIQMDTIPQSEIISSQMPSAKLLHWHISLTDSHRGLSYFNCLHEYSRRHLGNPMDILRAFTGILQYFFGNDHLSGIPVCEFSKALLWYPVRCERPRKSQKGFVFPSWSWTTAITPLEHQHSSNTLIMPVASCASNLGKSQSRKKLSVVSVAGLVSSSCGSMETYLKVADIARKEGMIGMASPAHASFSGSQDDFETHLRTTFDAFLRSHEEELLREFSADQVRTAAETPGQLLMLTQSTRLELDSNIQNISGRNTFNICAYALPVGFLLLDHIEHEEHIVSGLQDWDEVSLEFLALSISPCYNGPLLQKRHGEYSVDVMAIETRGGVSHRIGIGQVFLERWVELSPRFGTFVLK